MKVLITGGAGFLGRNLIKNLQGYEITVLDLQVIGLQGVESIVGDVRNEFLVESLVRQVDAVVHAAAALPLYREDEIYSTDYIGTKVVAGVCKSLNKRLIHISTTAVYDPKALVPYTENSHLRGVGAYGQAKVQAECECNFDGAVVLRPKTFIGPGRLGIFSLLYEFAYECRDFPILGSGDRLFQMLDVADLCEVIKLFLQNNESGIFNVGAGVFGTIKTDFQFLLAYANAGKIVCLPEKPAKAILSLLSKLRMSPVYEWAYETMTKDSVVNIEKLMQTLSWKPKYSNQGALQRNYDWYLKNRHSFNVGINHTSIWTSNFIKAAKWFF